MRSIEVRTVSTTVTPEAAFDLISNFERYSELVDEVNSVRVHPHEAGHLLSDWEVQFRNGPLRWSEVDYIQPELRRIVFEQTTGDFHTFRGVWNVKPVETGCEVTFEATFDFGIPSLEGILEPIATKVLKEGIAIIVHRLLGDATVVGDPMTHAAVLQRMSVDAGSDLMAS